MDLLLIVFKVTSSTLEFNRETTMFTKGVIVIQVVIMFIFDEIPGKYVIRKKTLSHANI